MADKKYWAKITVCFETDDLEILRDLGRRVYAEVVSEEDHIDAVAAYGLADLKPEYEPDTTWTGRPLSRQTKFEFGLDV